MRTVTVTDRKEVVKVASQLVAEYNIKYAGVDDMIMPHELIRAITIEMEREILKKLENLPE